MKPSSHQQLHGKYAITSGNYVSYMLANVKQHADFEILAAGSIMQPQVQELMIPAGSPVRTVNDLRGKTIALNALNGIGQLLVSAALEANMMSPKQVNFTTIQFPDMAAALKQHKVAAAFMPQPFATNAEDSVGAQPLADLDQGAVTSLPISGYVVTKSWLQKYPKTAAAFRKALVEAQRIADTDPGAVEKAMVQYSQRVGHGGRDHGLPAVPAGHRPGADPAGRRPDAGVRAAAPAATTSRR